MPFDLTLAVDDEDLRDAGDSVLPRDFSSFVEQSCESVAFPLYEFAGDLDVFIVDAEHDQSAIFEIPVQFFDVRQLGHARAAPTGPKIEQRDLAFERLQVNPIPVQVFQRESDCVFAYQVGSPWGGGSWRNGGPRRGGGPWRGGGLCGRHQLRHFGRSFGRDEGE